MTLKKEITVLKIILILLAIANTVFAFIFFPVLAEFLIELKPELSFLQYPFLIILFSTTLIILIIAFNGYKLLVHLDEKELILIYIIRIKKLFFSIILINIIISPLIYLIAEVDDAPGIIFIHFIVIIWIALFAFGASLVEKTINKN